MCCVQGCECSFFCVKYENDEDFRKDLSWFNGSHTAAVADVSHVMSADDEMTVWELSRFFVQSFAN